MQPTRLNRSVIYESPWVNLYRDRVALPTGLIIEQYHCLEFGLGSVNVIVENQANQILMEQIARYPTGETTWELPAGHIEAEESIQDAAAREVLEETGYETSGHQLIYTYYPVVGMSNTKIYVLHCLAGRNVAPLDKNEICAVRWFDQQELWELIRRREITDGLALIGLLLHLNKSAAASPEAA